MLPITCELYYNYYYLRERTYLLCDVFSRLASLQFRFRIKLLGISLLTIVKSFSCLINMKSRVIDVGDSNAVTYFPTHLKSRPCANTNSHLYRFVCRTQGTFKISFQWINCCTCRELGIAIPGHRFHNFVSAYRHRHFCITYDNVLRFTLPRFLNETIQTYWHNISCVPETNLFRLQLYLWTWNAIMLAQNLKRRSHYDFNGCTAPPATAARTLMHMI